MATVTVNSSWLSNTANSLHGDGVAPYVLSTDNTIYQLAQDVNVTTTGYFGQVFVFTGKNIYLDTNGYSVRINGSYVRQERLSQKSSTHAYKSVPSGTVKNQSGLVELQNGTTTPINLDPVRKDTPITNPEKF